jgi:pimeloyl-ACP methyl ester carboxylesterase
MKRLGRIVLIVLIVLLMAVLIGPFLVPIPPLKGTVPPERLADPDSRFIELNGLKVHYKQAGQGTPALLLLHGFGASTFSWREVLSPLAKYGTVIAYDRPAFGLTSRPMPGEGTGESPYSSEVQADMVVAMMDAKNIERAVLVGNSAGGTIAMLAALRHSERVQALVLVDAAIYQSGGASDWMRPLFQTPQMRRIGPLLMRSIQNWGNDFLRSAWHDPGKITPEIWSGYRKPLQAENWDRALWELYLASRSPGLSNRLTEIKTPALVITGDDDRIVPTENSIRLARELPNAKLVVIPNCGHVPHEECPAEFLQAVAEFLGTLN